MKKHLRKLFFVLGLLPVFLKADEGMWFLMFIERLNMVDMQKEGLHLSADEIYSVNHNSLKDAIVQFAGGCTAEIVSDQGLVFTNHHCGYASIAELSTPEHDYLTNGFWAKNKNEELKPKSLSVRFFVRMDDVSKRILSKVNAKMSEAEREKIINQEIALIQKENDGGGKYTVSVKSFFQGNEYYYFVYQDYNDVRLVGTPPSSIGKFGGDTDNWEWPRHTGDFSVFRVYTDKNGNPSEYSSENIPLKPKYYLPISLKGVQENDFAMIMGYPGRTNRWMPASGVDQNVNFAYPAWVESSKLGMDVFKKYMDKNQAVKIDYASKYASVANYWKNRQGMIDALKKHNTADKKRKIESKFEKWTAKKDNFEVYGNVVKNINEYYSETNEIARHDNYLIGLIRTSAFASLPYKITQILEKFATNPEDKRAELASEVEEQIEGIYNGLYLPLEQDVLTAQLNLYYQKAKAGGLAPYINEIGLKNEGDFKSFIAYSFERSFFNSKESIESFISNPDIAVLKQDPLYILSNDIMSKYRDQSPESMARNDQFNKNFRLMVKGLQVSELSSIKYPDANSTLRLTYGSIKGLPEDKRNDASKNYYTTLKGTVAKYKKGDDEFDLPQRLIDLYNQKDFGPYADKAGYMPVNFLSNNDITGGNSGSPIMNGDGELIGLAFDGNIEAMAGDVIFDPVLQRTINVDIRYVLFIIDKYAGATNLIDELKLVK